MAACRGVNVGVPTSSGPGTATSLMPVCARHLQRLTLRHWHTLNLKLRVCVSWELLQDSRVQATAAFSRPTFTHSRER